MVTETHYSFLTYRVIKYKYSQQIDYIVNKNSFNMPKISTLQTHTDDITESEVDWELLQVLMSVIRRTIVAYQNHPGIYQHSKHEEAWLLLYLCYFVIIMR